jgi:hypothetical protein
MDPVLCDALTQRAICLSGRMVRTGDDLARSELDVLLDAIARAYGPVVARDVRQRCAERIAREARL